MNKLGILNLCIDNKLEKSLFFENYDSVPISELSELSKLSGFIVLIDKESDFVQVCNWIIKASRITTLFTWVFTADCREDEKTMYFNLGVNGVIDSSKHFMEGIYIVSNVLSKLYNPDISANPEFVNFKLCESNLSLNLDGDREINLTNAEYKLMKTLYQNKNNAVPYEIIWNTLWPKRKEEKVQLYRIANIIFHLRKKIGREGDFLITTVRSKGYKLVI